MTRHLVLLALCALASPGWAQEPLGAETLPASANEPVLDYANSLYQRQWVRVDESGGLSGRLFVLSSIGREPKGAATIELKHRGNVVYTTQPDFDGTFRINDIPVGTYAMIVSGKTTFAAFALHILPASESHLPSRLEVLSTSMTPGQVKSLVAPNLVPQINPSAEYYRMFENDPLAENRISAQETIVLSPNGTLTGTISRPGWRMGEQDMSGNIAQVLQNGEVVGSAAVNRSGTFNIPDMSPGIYDLVVGGDDGYAAVPFQAIQVEDIAQRAGDARFVSTQGGSTLAVELIEQADQPTEVEEEDEDEPVVILDDLPVSDVLAPTPGAGLGGPRGFPGGVGGAGGGAGAGGGGIGGGLGGVAGAAGLAVGVAALADDDDGFNLNVASLIAP